MAQLPAIGAEVPQLDVPLVAGNIDLSNRPRVQNADGSVSTVRSMSFEQNGKEILVPTVIDGRVVSNDEAIAHYRKTGQHLGIFATPAAATAFAQQLHENEARKLELPPIGGEVGARVPDFRATNEPPSTALKAAAYGKDALQLALDALPGAGAVIGGALATPETMGAGTLTGAALGAGAGRGLRDLIAAGLGLQKPTTAIAEGGKIAMDAGETYAAGLVLPALWEAIKRPGATVADVFDGMRKLYAASPKAVKAMLPDFEALAKLPKGVGKAPAAILERPAWQTWQDHLPDAQPSPQVARSTSTSMIPAPVPASSGTVTPPPPTVTPSAAAPAPSEFTAARAARQAAAEPIVAASGKMQLTAAEMKEFTRLVNKGMKLPDALEAVKAMRALATRFGSPTDVEVTQTIARRGYKS